MRVFYKCKCLGAEQAVDVPDRLPSFDVADWVGGIVAQCVAFDHSQRSPMCRRSAMQYVAIPMDNHAPGIGVPVTRQ